MRAVSVLSTCGNVTSLESVYLAQNAMKTDLITCRR
jgi:hypothetical protein